MTPIFPRSNSARGFTLIEMLVVLGVLSLLAVIVSGSFGSRPGALARGEAAQKLSVAIEGARWQAMRSGTLQSVDPAALVPGVTLAPGIAAGASPAGRIVVHADGSSNGGVLSLEGRPLLRIDWLTGETSRAS